MESELLNLLRENLISLIGLVVFAIAIFIFFNKLLNGQQQVIKQMADNLTKALEDYKILNEEDKRKIKKALDEIESSQKAIAPLEDTLKQFNENFSIINELLTTIKSKSLFPEKFEVNFIYRLRQRFIELTEETDVELFHETKRRYELKEKLFDALSKTYMSTLKNIEEDINLTLKEHYVMFIDIATEAIRKLTKEIKTTTDKEIFLKLIDIHFNSVQQIYTKFKIKISSSSVKNHSLIREALKVELEQLIEKSPNSFPYKEEIF